MFNIGYIKYIYIYIFNTAAEILIRVYLFPDIAIVMIPEFSNMPILFPLHFK